MSGEKTEHRGTVTERLDRLETALVDLRQEVRTLRDSGSERRLTDEARLRKIEDHQLVWDTRWATIGTMLTRVFGVSIIAAVASLLSIVLALSQLAGMS